MKVNGILQVAFTQMGEMLHWHSSSDYSVIFKDNYEFYETLKFVGIYRGRSAITFEWEDSTGKLYYMFAKDFETMVKHGTKIEDGRVTAKWTFVKRGANYGIRIC